MKKCLWIMALAVWSVGVQGQDTLQLTLEQALDIALSENPTIRIADKEIERQDYVKRETRGYLLPQLDASGSYSRAVKKNTVDLGGGQKFSFEPTNTVAGTANLTLPLFAPAVYKTLKLNDEQMRAAVEAARASRITLINEVNKAFYNILLAEESLVVLRASAANLQQTVDQTQSLFDQDLSSEYDLLTAQVQLSNLQPTILQTESSIDVAKRMLKMLMFIPEDIEIALSGDLESMLAETGRNMASLYPDLSNNTDIRQLEIQENILYQQLRIAQTNRMPSLAAVGSFQVLGRNKISLGTSGFEVDTDGTALPNATKESWETQTPLSIGLQLSVPIFSGFTRINQERQIKNSMEQLRLQRDYLKESVDVQVRNAITDILTAQAQMTANEATINQARRGYEIARTRYFAGVGTMLELNSAELALTQARLNYSQSMYDYLSAQSEYNYILGREF